MAAATAEQLQALRTESETAYKQLAQRVDAIDTLVARIDAGLKKADENFTTSVAQIKDLDSKMNDANAAFRGFNPQGLQLERAGER